MFGMLLTDFCLCRLPSTRSISFGTRIQYHVGTGGRATCVSELYTSAAKYFPFPTCTQHSNSRYLHWVLHTLNKRVDMRFLKLLPEVDSRGDRSDEEEGGSWWDRPRNKGTPSPSVACLVVL